MEFASPIPLLVRRCVLPITCLGLASISCFGQSVYLTVSATPYDRQMIRVFPVLASTNGQWPNQISPSSAVTQWMSELRAVPYQYSKHWQTPTEINLAQATDCKGKAVALYAQMRKNGAKNLRMVIGRHHIYDSATHAWLEWETAGGSYVLDPTFNATPAKKVELSPMTYVPLYAFDGEHKYRAANAGVVAPTAKVAAGYASHPYAPASAGSTLANAERIGVKSGQSFSAAKKSATTSTQNRQADLQHSGSNLRQSSSANVAKLRQSRTVAAAPSAKTQVHANTVPTQKRPGPNVRVLRSNVAQRNQPRVIAATSSPKGQVRAKPSVTSRASPPQKRAVSNTRLSPSNVAARSQARAIAGTAKAKVVTKVQPKPAAASKPLSIQKRPASHARFSAPHAVGVRQTGKFPKTTKQVTQVQPRPVSAASQL